MAIARDDRWVADAQGRALAGAAVYWCTQPATVPVSQPPSPLASIYTSLAGTTPETQPVLTDGFGHAWAYLDNSLLYTIAIYHPLFGEYPVILSDQEIAGGGGGGSTLTPFAGVPIGTIDGTNKVFTLANGSSPLGIAPTQATVWLNFPLINGLGYTLSGDTITYAVAPQPASGGVAGDSIYAQGFYSA